jgi:hypothetical protein
VVSAAALEERQQKRAEQDGQNCLSSWIALFVDSKK